MDFSKVPKNNNVYYTSKYTHLQKKKMHILDHRLKNLQHWKRLTDLREGTSGC